MDLQLGRRAAGRFSAQPPFSQVAASRDLNRAGRPRASHRGAEAEPRGSSRLPSTRLGRACAARSWQEQVREGLSQMGDTGTRQHAYVRLGP